MNAILALYNQIINHSFYRGQPFTLRQLTWMKLECLYDVSIGQLCKAFFKEVDRLLETSTYEVYVRDGRRSINDMLDNMATIAAGYYLGVLIIDNVQNLCAAKGNNASSVLNFLGYLSHHLGIPVVLVGTPKALSILGGEFFEARRVSEQGIFSWSRMQEDGEWNIFTEALWKYQYVRQPIPLSEELRHTLYDESQGIADLAIKVYMLAQIEAITHAAPGEKEVLTKNLLHSVAQNHLCLVQPFLNALRAGEKGIEELEKYGGSAPVNLEKVVQEAKVKVQEAQNEAPKQG